MRNRRGSVQSNYLPRYNKLLRVEVIGNKSVAQGIIVYARESGTDVIVIGTKGLTGVGKFIMSGVPSSVINNAYCPVVSIK